MNHDTTQPSLLLRVRDPSDQQAWCEFEAKYGELILRYCRRHGLQPVDCEDVRQLVWLNLAKGLRSFEYEPARGRFRSYLGRVVQNAIARHFARPDRADRALDQSVLAIVAQGADADDPQWHQEWVDHHYRLAMAHVRTSFDPRSVEIFDRVLAGEAISAVAQTFNVSEQAVHKVKQRIKSRLQELIARQIREEDEPDATPTL